MKVTTAAILKAIKRDHEKENLSIKAIAAKYEIGSSTAANAIKAVDLADFERLQKERSAKNTTARRSRKAVKANNDKQVEAAAEKVKDLGYAYTPKQAKQKIDAALALAELNNERLDTIASLLVGDNDGGDNLVSRVYRLESKTLLGLVRRFLARF